jgi:hypothetical protein
MQSSESELEQEISQSGNLERRPQLFRLLRQSELFFLVPYHPELTGGKIRGAPHFVVWKSDMDGRRVVIFTSEKRAHEATTKLSIPAKQYAVASMIGVDVFGTIADCGENFTINPASGAERQLFMDAATAASLADGWILMPNEGGMTGVKVEDYPEPVLGPMREYLARDRGIFAAWLLEVPQTPGDTSPHKYVFGFYGKGSMERRKRAATSMAVKASQGAYDAIGVVIAGNDPAMAVMFEQMPPFYASPDHDRPIPPWPPK